MAVNVTSRAPLLSIGEFSAVTQLSPKALRLYDEQRILQPARTDPSSGYRYYRREQVPLGRLIRTLRDMHLPLADVARVVEADRCEAEHVLNQFAAEVDRRYAQDKRAMQTALLLLRGAGSKERLTIEQRTRPEMMVAVWPFVTDRAHFYGRLQVTRDSADRSLTQALLRPSSTFYCRLVNPLSEEETQVELLIPIDAAIAPAREVTLRHLAAASCAVIDITASTSGADFSAPVDALFDWFDQRGFRAVDTPWLARTFQGQDLHAEALWAYQAHALEGG